ncbi:MAG: M24 family metallopeptidase [Gammaproteobacteria bacterium]|nr:M24 family metallopeptidase [Gammaproteobacteria bacterium]
MIEPEALDSIQQFRIGQIRCWLEKNDCAGIILFDPVNVRYATGSRNMQVWTMHNICRYALILQSGKIVLFDLPSSMHLAKHLNHIHEIRPAFSPDHVIVGNRSQEISTRLAADLKSVLADSGVAKERIAIDRADLEIVFAFQRENVNLVDGKPIMDRARSIKSVEEIAALTMSLRTCEQSVADMKARLEPGMTESQAMGLMIKGSIDRGGEYPETRLLTSGPRTNPWFQETSDRVIENGDMLAFDTDMIGPLGFYNDISRSWVVGDKKPNDTQKRLYNLAHELIQHNFSLLQPGMGFLDYSDNAYQLPGNCLPNRYADVAHGCGLGVEYPLIWYREDEQWGAYDGVFEENMVVCIECYVGELHGHEGVKLEQPIWLKADGPVLLSEFPLEEDYLV